MNGGENDTCVGEGSDGQDSEKLANEVFAAVFKWRITRTRCMLYGTLLIARWQPGREEFGRWIHVYVWLSCSDMHLKPSQHG